MCAGFLILGLAGTARAGKRYDSFMIDRVDMTAILGKPISLFSASKSWFERTETGAGARISDYRDGGCQGSFDFADSGALIHRSRALSVLEGRFGHIYARCDYWYPPESPRIAVNTSAASRAMPHRAPVLLGVAQGPAESFALIRVLKAGKTFKIASADYGLDGALKALRVDVSSGDWTASEVSFTSSTFTALIWGLPAAIDTTSFPGKPFAGVAEPGENIEMEAALIYRARGILVERIMRHGSRIDREWLSFPLTEIERALSKTEAAFPFLAGPGG